LKITTGGSMKAPDFWDEANSPSFLVIKFRHGKGELPLSRSTDMAVKTALLVSYPHLQKMSWAMTNDPYPSVGSWCRPGRSR
jgi:hypothetical protein